MGDEVLSQGRPVFGLLACLSGNSWPLGPNIYKLRHMGKSHIASPGTVVEQTPKGDEYGLRRVSEVQLSGRGDVLLATLTLRRIHVQNYL